MTAIDALAKPSIAELYDPFDLSDPFPFYQRARAEEPVFWNDDIGYWIITRHDDVREIFKDLETFSSANTGRPIRPHSPRVKKILDDGGMTIQSGMTSRMPPDHTRIRRFINKGFTPKRTKSLEEPVRRWRGWRRVSCWRK